MGTKDTFMIVKMDISPFCEMKTLFEVNRAIGVFCAPMNEVTYCCSATKMIFCEDLGVQLDFTEGVPLERQEEIEEMFQGDLNNTYYQASTVDKLPRMGWGEFPPKGATGCVIETEFDDSEDLIEFFRGNGG